MKVVPTLSGVMRNFSWILWLIKKSRNIKYDKYILFCIKYDITNIGTHEPMNLLGILE